MEIAWGIGLTVANLIWLGLTAIGLPGTWLMVIGTAVVAWIHWDGGGPPMFSVPTLVVIVVLATLGEVVEFIAGIFGSTRAGGTRWGAGGALLGGVVGGIVGTFAIPVPFFGSLIGACVGAGLGAWGFELAGGLEMDRSIRSGVGAGIGRLLGTVAKLIAGAAILIIVAVAAFWP